MKIFIASRWFALLVLTLVIISGFILYRRPQLWTWVLLPAVTMVIIRLVVRPASFQTPWLVASLIVFVTTAAIGCVVAYNGTAAWNKFCLIIVAILFYVSLAAQSIRNIHILAGLGLSLGVGVASYFLLTADFAALAVKFPVIHRLGVVWMNVRPNIFQSASIHPNDTAGISIIAGVYGLPLLRSRNIGYAGKIIVLGALGIVLIAFVLASSRGAFLGLIGALGVWLAWRFLPPLLPAFWKEKFSYLVIAAILALEAVVLFIPSGLLGSSFSLSGNVLVSRADVFRSGLTILRDFPFTGGGLDSFPGLYSQYVLVMPFEYLPHSHNMILNVMIEQGVLGGIAFVLIYLMAVHKLLSAPRNASTQSWQLAACLSLFVAIFHGMVDDYLYETSGPALALVPAGMAVLVSRLGAPAELPDVKKARRKRRRSRISWQQSVVVVAPALVLLALIWKPVIAQWYANMGAVKLAKIELENFPTGQWSEGGYPSQFDPAKLNLQKAIAYQPDNQTANYRLGLIHMSARDYSSASAYLQTAYEQDATNRGVIKNLGYSYLWSGEIEKARPLLTKIPEAKRELEVYTWWWNDRGRPDLAEHASELLTGFSYRP